MARFEEVLPALLAGKKVRRKCWITGNWLMLSDIIPVDSMLADDWDVAKEKVKKTVWMNVYQDENMIYVTGGAYGTKEIAEAKVLYHLKYLGAHPATVEVEE